ncbi:MAG: PAS domain-containing sensor histidine kinase [Vicingus serpentipes]|nr:PAS domain-containing sensor histidine kinase [Vicingus serpentipes]
MNKSNSSTGNNYSVFDNMLEGVQIINPDFEYVYVNDTVAKHGKSSKEQLLGKKMMDIYPGIEHTQMFDLLKKCMNERINQKMINEFDFPDGSKGYFDLIMNPVSEGVLIMSIDITEQKRMENELRKLNNHLEDRVLERTEELSRSLEREKKLNEMKTNFISFASHEIKTPIAAIKINVEMLEKRNDEEDKELRIEHYKQIKIAVKSMFETIDDYLSIGKMEENIINEERSEFNFPEYIKSEVEKLMVICKQHQKIKYKHEGNEEIIMDQKILKSIVSNLLSNAIKYSKDDIDLYTKIQNNHLVLEVVDKGIGTPENDQKELFQKFYRASNAQSIRGTGLGLNIIKKYVELLNGHIDFESKLKKGTTFKVKIPCTN